MTIDAYPLQWPIGWKRTDAQRRREAKFGRASQRSGTYVPGRALTMAEAVQRLLAELERMAVDQRSVVISTNVRPTLAGIPRSGERKPDDPGAAVYWTDPFDSRKPRVMAIDQYNRVEDNIAALAATIEAMRAIERHGGAVILERAFTGFEALPAPGQSAKREWWDVLQCRRDASIDVIRAQYRRLASQYHPDKPGGSHEAMAELNAAQEQALRATKD